MTASLDRARPESAPFWRTGSEPFCPYKGLLPFTEDDQAFFFGRERDREIIAANLYAAPLTILYGASGVGKSSVLLAGVLPKLRATPRLAVLVVRNWQDPDLLVMLKNCVLRAVSQRTGRPIKVDSTLPFDEFLLYCAHALRGPIFFIFDQFEEFFLYHPPSPASDEFDAQFARAVNRQEIDVHFLLSLREDGLSKLDRFRGRIPNLLSNRLRLEHLDREAAIRAIRKPLEEYNRRISDGAELIGIEGDLVEMLLEDVQPGRVRLDQAGQGQIERRTHDTQSETRIEAPYLQLVMTRLWHEEMRLGSHGLRLATFERLGGAERIVREHLNEALATLTPVEQEVAADVFRYLVTPSGIKVAHSAGDLASFVEQPEAKVLTILEKLSGNVRILVPVAPANGAEAGPRYTIFHDVLGPAVLEWLRQARDRRRVARARREGVGRGAAAILTILILGLAIFAVRQWAEATTQQRMAQSRELAANAIAQLTNDVDLGLLLALEAVDVERTPAAESALRTALVESRQSHVLAVIGGEIGSVNEATYSPDGRAVVTASNDGTARIWDTATGALSRELPRHEGGVNGVGYSQDGRLIVTAAEKKARVWEAATGRLVGELGPHQDFVRRARFSPDGKLVVTTSGRAAQVWDVASGEQRLELGAEAARVWSASFSPDGSAVVTAGGSGTARVWDAHTGQQLQELRGHRGQVRSAVYSPDGRRLVTASQDGTARVWEASTAREVTVLRGHAGTVWDAAFSSDGKHVVTAGDDSTARVWDVATGRQVAVLRAHAGRLWSATYSPDGQSILTAGDDQTARVWEASAENIPLELRAHDGPAWSVALSPDGRYVVTAGGDKTARVLETREWSKVRELEGHTDQVLNAAFSADGNLIVTASYDRTAWVWSATAGTVLNRLPDHGSSVNRAAFSPVESTIVTASDDGVTHLWDPRERRVSHLTGHSGAVLSVAFSPDGRFMATASSDRTARLWDAASGQELRVLSGHTGPVWGIAYSPDGRFMATASSDRTARLWDAASGQELRVLSGHGGEVRGVAFSSDGRLLLTVGADGIARIWETATGKLLMELPRQGSRINGVATFSPEGPLVLTVSEDGVLQVAACPSYLCSASVDDLREYARTRARQPTSAEQERFHIRTRSP